MQSPPPRQIDEAAIVRSLDPRKDVDGFHPENIAKLALGDPTGLVPCTPLGVQRLLIESKIDISGAHVIILGRSMIVGKPHRVKSTSTDAAFEDERLRLQNAMMALVEMR